MESKPRRAKKLEGNHFRLLLEAGVLSGSALAFAAGFALAFTLAFALALDLGFAFGSAFPFGVKGLARSSAEGFGSY